jgi:hypothetical protein
LLLPGIELQPVNILTWLNYQVPPDVNISETCNHRSHPIYDMVSSVIPVPMVSTSLIYGHVIAQHLSIVSLEFFIAELHDIQVSNIYLGNKGHFAVFLITWHVSKIIVSWCIIIIDISFGNLTLLIQFFYLLVDYVCSVRR